MGIGARLREERERLGLNQEGFGQLGGVRKQAQLLYEKDERKPDSDYLVAVAAAGVDVLFVLTYFVGSKLASRSIVSGQFLDPEPASKAVTLGVYGDASVLVDLTQSIQTHGSSLTAG